MHVLTEGAAWKSGSKCGCRGRGGGRVAGGLLPGGNGVPPRVRDVGGIIFPFSQF